MAKAMFKSQNHMEKFNKVLQDMEKSYKEGTLTPLECRDALMINYGYSNHGAVRVIEMWRQKHPESGWGQLLLSGTVVTEA